MTHLELIERSATVRKAFTHKGQNVSEYVHLAAHNTRELLDFVNTPISAAFQIQRRAMDKTHPSETSWDGCKDRAGALDLLVNGWPEGTKRAKELAQRIFANMPLKGARPALETRRSVAPVGCVNFSVPSLIQGHPAAFLGQFEADHTRKFGKCFQVGVNVSASGGVGSDILLARAASIGALCQSLITLGYSIGLTLCDVSVGCVYDSQNWQVTKRNHVVTSWRAVQLGKHFNMDNLVFACGHPTAFRRFMFAMEEHTPAAFCGAWTSSYGSASDLQSIAPDLTSQYDLFVDSNGCVTPKGQTMLPMWTDPNEQAEWIKLQLENQGIVFPKGRR